MPRFFQWQLGFCALVFSLMSCEDNIFQERIPEAQISVLHNNNRISVDEPYFYDFPELRVGERLSQQFIIHNTGDSDLRIGKIQSDAKFFIVEVKGEDDRTLKPGERLSFSVHFQPHRRGELVGNISFFTSARDMPIFRFTLRGIGTQPPIINSQVLVDNDSINGHNFRDGGENGTIFILSMFVDDASGTIREDDVELHLKGKFSGEEDMLEMIKRGDQLEFSPSKDRVSTRVAVRFGLNSYIDIQAQMFIEGGSEASNTINIRISRPRGAN
ncbi:MAG: DUF1573 domain-containing protein [Bernardetiaceae bacterium]|nr:DUF1573 domain-containing protein [Bernardetiaceae bacterium]